jgi:hypothetical protein
MALHYAVDGRASDVEMNGSGPLFGATLRGVSPGLLGYQLSAVSGDGRRSTSEAYEVPVVAGFVAPRLGRTVHARVWSPERPLVVRTSLESGQFARELRLHYREADQNRDFRVLSLPAGRSGTYGFEIETSLLDTAYDLLFYLEVVDVMGKGTFAPDPFSEARFWVSRIKATRRPGRAGRALPQTTRRSRSGGWARG